VFLTRGYHGTRVDDLAAAAGVSHGAFYRYFRNKDDLALLFVARAIRTISRAFVDIPDVVAPPDGSQDGAVGQAALRRWLRRYNAVHLDEAAMVRVWIDATLQDSSLIIDSVPALDWGRRRMVRYLEPRGFGDVDTDAVIMVSLISGFGAEPRSPAAVDGGARIIERGLCGR
jgi:AcrR family transcriptional regulator